MLTVAALAGVMSLVSAPFASADNIFNISRNFAFIGLVALGQTAVIATGGIDLSVGSVMGLSGIVTGLVLGRASLWCLPRRLDSVARSCAD